MLGKTYKCLFLVNHQISMPKRYFVIIFVRIGQISKVKFFVRHFLPICLKTTFFFFLQITIFEIGG